MMKIDHELPLLFVDRRPDIAVRVATERGLKLPSHASMSVTSGDLSRTASVTERRVDRVVMMVDDSGNPVGVLLVEVQRSKDDEARTRWPGKLIEAWERHECDAYLLVFCLRQDTARWAAEPLRIGHPDVSGLTFRGLAVGPDALPVVDDADRVPYDPEMSVLAALAHGPSDPSLSTCVDAFRDLKKNPRPNAKLNYTPEQYLNFLYDAGSEAIRRRMEEHMATTTDGYFRYSIPFLRDAQDKAYAEAYAKFYEEAKAHEEAKGKARSQLLELLEVRGVEIDNDQRNRVVECGDEAQLRAWFRAAATATDAEDVFGSLNNQR